jgi:hypothetical protein
MKNKLFIWSSLCVWMATLSVSEAATIPSGTTLSVRTADPILSSSRVGRTYKAEIAHAVKVNGKVVLHAGTPCTVVVETAFGDMKRSSALTLNLTGISVDGKSVEVKTTGGFKLGAGVKTGSRNISVYGKNYTYPRGTQLTFKLARPLNT